MPPSYKQKWQQNFTQTNYKDILLQELNSGANFTILSIDNLEEKTLDRLEILIKRGAVISILNDRNSPDEVKTLTSMLQRPTSTRWWNPEAHHVIVSTSVPPSSQLASRLLEEASTILNTFKIILLMPETVQIVLDSSLPDIVIYTWLPTEQTPQCSKKLTQIRLIDRWVSNPQIGTGFKLNTNLFPSKEDNVLTGCDVTVLTVHWPPLIIEPSRYWAPGTDMINNDGLIIRIFDTAAKLYGFKPEYKSFSQDYSEKDTMEPDVFGPQPITKIFSSQYDFMHSYFTDGLTWFVPQGGNIPRWLGPIRVFQPMMWLLVLSVYSLCSFTFWALEVFQSKNSIYQGEYSRITVSFINMLRCILGTGIRETSKGPVSVLLFSLWLFYCMLIYTAYQSSLIGFLTKIGHYPTIKDVHELDGSGIELASMMRFWSENLRKELYVKESLTTKSIINCTLDTEQCFNQVAYEKNLAILGMKSNVEFEIFPRYWHNGKPLIVPIQDNINDFQMVMYFDRGSKILKYVNNVSCRLRTAGITDRWLADIKVLARKETNFQEIDQDIMAMSLQHLQGAFYLLLIGLLLSLLVFVVQTVHHNFNLHV
jgi:hypothetical protein